MRQKLEKMLPSGGFFRMPGVCTVLFFLASVVVVPQKTHATSTKHNTGIAHSSAATVHSSRNATAIRPASRASTSSRTIHSRRGRRASARSQAPSYQLHPDPDRYLQIQHALLERGYLKMQPDGTWNEDSIDALKRFQNDQKLEADGKINALTLTSLGLGPKHDGTSASTVPLSATAASPSNPPETAPPSELPPGETPPVETSPQ